MGRKVLSFKCIPTRFPVWSSVTIYLLMDKFNATPFVWGIVGTLWGFIVMCAIVALFTEDRVDVFNSQNKEI